MCLVLLSFKCHLRYPFVFASNRDESYARPSASVAFWDDVPDVLAGRDMKDGGTWMGVTRKGRFAALTNYRDIASMKDGAPSRGWLVRDYLCGQETPVKYLESVAAIANRYNAFNLIAGDVSQLFYFSNRSDGHITELSPGLYGLSNDLLDTPWVKVERGKKLLGDLLAGENDPDPEDIFKILADRSIPDDSQLPDTGIGLEWERILSPLFIAGPNYGTRSSLILMVDRKGHAKLLERNYNSHPDPWMTAKYEFRIQRD